MLKTQAYTEKYVKTKNLQEMSIALDCLIGWNQAKSRMVLRLFSFWIVLSKVWNIPWLGVYQLV